MKTILLLIAAVGLCGQDAIPLEGPPFMKNVDYAIGDFTIRIIADDKDPRGSFIAIGSSGKATHAILKIFYWQEVPAILKAGPLLRHQEIVCPVVARFAGTACNDNLHVPIRSIQMIRITALVRTGSDAERGTIPQDGPRRGRE